MKVFASLVMLLGLTSLPSLASTPALAVSQGEDVTLTLKLVNVGETGLQEVNASLDPLTTPRWIRSEAGTHRSVEVPAKSTDDQRPSTMLPLTFTVDKQAPENVEINVHVLIRDGNGQVWTKQFPLKVTPRPKPNASLLLQNYPNPFNPETWIPYQLAKPAHVRIYIYEPKGHLVRTLDLGHQVAGFYTSRAESAYWDGRNHSGEQVASGLYFYHIQNEHFSAIRRMVIVK